MDIFKAQAEFLEAADIKVHEEGSKVTKDMLQLPFKLIQEEYVEVFDAILSKPKSVRTCKEAIDLIYVTAQYLNQLIGPDKASKLFDAVHKNNMSKCIDGKLVKRADGKVLKPEGFDKDGWLDDYLGIIKNG